MRMTRRKEKIFLMAGSFVMLALIGLTACGGTAYKQRTSTTSGGNPTDTGAFPGFPDDFPDLSDTPFPDAGDLPPYGFSFDITGNTGADSMYITAEEIGTDTILRVRIESGSAGPLDYPGYEAYSKSYGCVQYRVAVLQETEKDSGEFFEGQSRTSQPLSVDGADSYGICKDRNGRAAGTSQVLDFSSSTGSYGAVKIKVSNVKYDWKCRFWYDFANDWGENAASMWIGNYGTVCPLVPVYKTHTASGSIRIQTDATKAP